MKSPQLASARVAIVHDWLTGMRGGEAVLEAIAELFPEAPIFTLLAYPERLSNGLRSRKIVTSWLQNLPAAESRYRHYLPLMPFAVESLDLSGYDLILSSSHCVAKGVKVDPQAFHLSYIHAPMRYVWERFDDYFGPGRSGWLTRLGARVLRSWLQSWDLRSSRGVSTFISNSQFIADQVERIYGRKSFVVHPFADLDRFLQKTRQAADFYLIVGAFAPYKRVDLAIEVFNELRLPLKIIGSGQDEDRLRALAGPTVEFLGSCSDSEVAQALSNCRALIFPGVEDFGITPIEAMAAGAPVIALGQGGAKESVTSETGMFFPEPTKQSLQSAVMQWELRLPNLEN
ncbi:MAG: glycosyltransferase, partial [Bdellovibrionales bacterium]|nr:glycosyltransferase [Bdellovibrionales bacterium]